MNELNDLVEVPTQFLPPVLEFDALYLHPLEEYDKASAEYQKTLRAQQDYLYRKSANEREQESLAVAARAAATATKAAQEAQEKSVLAETRRKDEEHSASLRQQKTLYEAAVAQNSALKEQLEETLSAQKKAAAQRAEDELFRSQLLRAGAITALLVMFGTAFFTYRFGYTRGYRSSLEEALAESRERLAVVLQQKADLEAQVKKLTPPPPPYLDVAATQQIIEGQYREMDRSHNQEQADEMVAYYLPSFKLITHDNIDSRNSVQKDSIRRYFVDNALHQQITQIVEPLDPKPATQEEQGTSSDASKENKTKLSPLSVLNEDAVSVLAAKTIYVWSKIPDVSGNISADGAAIFQDDDIEIHLTTRDEWRREAGRWLLAKSESVSSSELPSGKNIPVYKCREIECGEYYTKGVFPMFTSEGKAIKLCPNCHRRLYLEGAM